MDSRNHPRSNCFTAAFNSPMFGCPGTVFPGRPAYTRLDWKNQDIRRDIRAWGPVENAARGQAGRSWRREKSRIISTGVLVVVTIFTTSPPLALANWASARRRETEGVE